VAQDLDIPQFFRRAPTDWLERYFKAQRLLVGFDWKTVSVRNVDSLMEAFLSLDEDTRGRLIEDFAYIKLLATPVGKLQIIDEAAYHEVQDEVADQLNKLDDVYACAFYVCLHHKECWEGAVFYAAADGKPKRYWRKRINLPRLGRLPTDDDGRALEQAISEVFRKKEGRGDHCIVRQLRRGEREYYFAYPQDHKLNTIQYDKGKMTKRPYNPAFEIVIVHNDSEGTLSIWHQGPKNRVKDLQQAFANAVLKQEIPWDNPPDDRVYDLDCFLDRRFQFSPAEELGVAKVEVRKIGIKVLGDDPHVVTIDLGPDADSQVLGRRIEAVTAGIRPTLRKVARVGCRVTFERSAEDKRIKTRSFELAWPNSCSLQNDAHGILIQRMLGDHGIEPRQREGDGADGDKGK
jgi:hypothetical protein